jgi:hypothetical protein
LAAAAGLMIVSIRPWREPTQGLVKNHALVSIFLGRVHGTDHFLGAGYRHRGGSKSMFMSNALIPMDEWCGSTN